MKRMNKPKLTTTKGQAYKDRLTSKDVWWKRYFDVQRPYRNNLNSLNLGYVLDVGCGIGRNLTNMSKLNIAAVGVDHNQFAIDHVTSMGFQAYNVEELPAHITENSFDTLLISHVLEHMPVDDAISLIEGYLPYLKTNGQIVVITPQEAGFRSDPTHIEFIDFEKTQQILQQLKFTTTRSYSFPLPRFAGHFFTHNEFVVVGNLTSE
jgi:2-polyprenyl-3-methyl-5-hydroxy-6-metoxy-1,4-benzoquinol methylase|tara:strand:+ start:1049 stop:1669 length:621 start_codon:yes stop_codon:yes gene_type:complete